MGTRGGGGYATGRNAVAICERCSKKVPYKVLRYDGQYPDLQVCPDCWDPKHPQEYLEDTFDPITLRDPTGDPDREFANNVYVRPWTLLKTSSTDIAGLRASVDIDIQPGKPAPNFEAEGFKLMVGLTLNASRFSAIVGSGIEVT